MHLHMAFEFQFLCNSEMSDDNDDDKDRPLGVFNPNQRQFFEDELRYREKLEQLHADNSSPTHLYIRPKEVELDVDLLDEYDSFYKTTASLLVLFQIMGIMPIRRSAPGEKMPRTTYHWKSKVFLWAYFIYGCQTILVVYTLQARIQNFLKSSKRFDEIIYNVIFISLLSPHFLLPVAAWRNGSEVAKFKNMWTNYQLQYFRVTGTPIVFKQLAAMSWVGCVASWLIAIVMMLSQYYFQPDFTFWHIFAYLPIIAMLNGFCCLWFLNTTAFSTASKLLAAKIEEALVLPRPSESLTKYRHLWVDLSHMMQQLGRAYSNMYGIYVLIIFFTTVIALYGVMSEVLDHGVTFKELGLVIIVFYCMSLLFIICNKAQDASEKVGLEFQTRLLNVNLTAVDKATQKEVEMFLIAIHKNPPIMNLDQYADINRSLITSNISFMATYLVVLLQFKLSLVRQSARQAAQKSLLNQTLLHRQ
ncbi:gustatory and odorant receptor 22-like [Sitodiplosis mosellana]|uniref:gustatory and odorant receptor 22-like n=1 Tax=Sitodiplosis mosellana TaxID=263140 RepID=UPI002444D786|nr:gustatory and odorant receptor 22-like [Sitodiplosis mosellana]